MYFSYSVKKRSSSSQRNEKFSALEGMAIESRSPSETPSRRKHTYSSPSSTRKSERLEERVRTTPAKWERKRFVNLPSQSPLMQFKEGDEVHYVNYLGAKKTNCFKQLSPKSGVVSKTKRRDSLSSPITDARAYRASFRPVSSPITDARAYRASFRPMKADKSVGTPDWNDMSSSPQHNIYGQPLFAQPDTNKFGTLPTMPQISTMYTRTTPLSLSANVSTYNSENECVELSMREVDSNIMDNVILPGLPDEVAKYCLAFVPASNFATIAVVSKKWRSYIMNKEMTSFRKLAGTVEEWLYVFGDDDSWVGVFDSSGQEVNICMGMPKSHIEWFEVVHLDGKFLIMGGLYNSVQLSSVYQYDCRLDRWSKLASMNVARYSFACAEVNGIIYVAGGSGISDEVLSSVEAYNVDENKWTMIDSLKYARDLCFGCGLDGKFYVMGGSIPNMDSPFEVVEIYDPEKRVWQEPFWLENKCHIWSAPGVMDKKLYLLDELNEKMVLMIWKVENNSWETIPIPSCNTTQFMEWLGILNGKVFVFIEEEEENKGAFLCYDPHASPGHEWHKICNISSSWSGCFSVTVKA